MKPADLLPKLILCADDDPYDRELLAETIMEIAPTYEIINATNGQDALTKLDKLKVVNRLPCLIILDMNMPVKDGKETLIEIKEDYELKSIPVVIFTTSARQIYADIALKYDVEIVTKPASMGMIVQEVTRLLSYCN
jgi:CheY-like chemotaxis protein